MSDHDLGDRNLVLPCGCTLGLHSIHVKCCDRHYQETLDERFDEPEEELFNDFSRTPRPLADWDKP